jgi:hypothetical protein
VPISSFLPSLQPARSTAGAATGTNVDADTTRKAAIALEKEQKEQKLRERFRSFWMASVADAFADDLEVIRKVGFVSSLFFESFGVWIFRLFFLHTVT